MNCTQNWLRSTLFRDCIIKPTEEEIEFYEVIEAGNKMILLTFDNLFAVFNIINNDFHTSILFLCKICEITASTRSIKSKGPIGDSDMFTLIISIKGII